MPIVVPLLGAAVGIGGSLLASGAQKSAAKTAAAAQTNAANLSVAEQRRQFDQTSQNFAPFLQAGKTALGQQGDLLGLNGSGAQQGSINSLQQSPLYQSLYRNGQNTILANSAATGGLRGGNVQNSLANFGSDTLAQVIQMQLGNLGGLSAQGQNAAGNLGGLGANTANQISNAYGDVGSANAGAALAAGKANAANFNNIAGSLGGLVGNKDVQGFFGKLF